jgi:hypothetical protein
MKKAVKRIYRAVDKKEKVLVYGEYEVIEYLEELLGEEVSICW